MVRDYDDKASLALLLRFALAPRWLIGRRRCCDAIRTRAVVHSDLEGE